MNNPGMNSATVSTSNLSIFNYIYITCLEAAIDFNFHNIPLIYEIIIIDIIIKPWPDTDI